MFEWEENLFLGLKALHRRWVVEPRRRDSLGVRMELKTIRQSLFLLAQMVSEKPVLLVETPNAVLCDREHVFLPTEFAVADSPEGNRALYQLKTLLAALAIRDGQLEWGSDEAKAGGLITRYAEEFPGMALLVETVLEGLPEIELRPLLGEPDFLYDPAERKSLAETPDQATESEAKMTEVEGKGQTRVSAMEGDDDQPVEAEMPIHTFEKAETLEEVSGMERKSDDDDELEEHAEALRSVDMKNVIRSAERPRSIYRSDLVLDGLSFEVGGSGVGVGLPYPEWDYNKASYRNDWCFVQEDEARAEDAGWLEEVRRRHAGLIMDLKKKVASIANEWMKAKRQPFGSEFDLEAVVENEVARRSGQTPGELCYIDRQRALHNVAACILMDQSYSTDSWVDDVRVLDTIRESILCMGEVLDDYIERFAIAGFSSNTRRECGFHLVKGFEESWPRTRARLGGLDAQGYTRIGPALRHAQELLMAEDAERKMIILITDGRPCDYDRYEGTYGVRDVRRAIETGRQHGIITHAFAVERRAREQFPKMFTQHHYDILPNPKALANGLCSLFLKLTTR